MTNTAVSCFILVSVQTMLISASEWNTTSNTSSYGDYNTTMAIEGNTVHTVSTMTNASVNVTEISYTSKGQYSTPHEFSKPTPPPPVFHSTPAAMRTTVKSKSHLTTPQPASGGSDTVGIIIVVVIIVIALFAALICYVARHKGRRYSVDLTSKPDETQIPLGTVETEAPVETSALNGLQFEGTEGSTQELQETHEPEVKLEDQVEQKAEPEKVTVDVSVDCAAPAADTSEDQPKQDAPEQSPAAPVDPSEGEKIEDEGAASNKTSESLKDSNEANENNSNSTVLPQRGARDGEAFWDISLDSMV